jgi:glutathione S-transferase
MALTLVSHVLCPYVQRAAIVLAEKGVVFTRRDVDLANKPDWFLAVSPLGKTPVLMVDDVPLFESAVICDYLDDTLPPRMHPTDALMRARHRAWVAFSSELLRLIGTIYSATDEAALIARSDELRAYFVRIESELGNGPWFSGNLFSIVDAAFAPVFRYFDVIDQFVDLQLFAKTPSVRAWRTALAARPSVRNAVDSSYESRLAQFLFEKSTALARRASAEWSRR